MQLFPTRGSHFDPEVNALPLVVAARVVTVKSVMGSRRGAGAAG
ncbi:MAG TPA: hypothetical protein VFN08_01835 [Gemmatimonadales bacterium]|nr:hypothetical protein [Gemmatimonadales bacterium]